MIKLRLQTPDISIEEAYMLKKDFWAETVEAAWKREVYHLSCRCTSN